MAEDPTLPEPPSSPDPLIATPLVRRTLTPPERPTLPPEIEGQLNQLTRTVQVLSAHFLGESDSDSAESLKERGARRVRKFHRAGGDDRSTAGGSGEEASVESGVEGDGDPMAEAAEGPSSLARNKDIAWPRQAPGTNTLSPAGWHLQPETRFRLGALGMGLLMLGLGFLIGHVTAPASAKAGKGGRTSGGLFDEAELAEQAFLGVNDALHAEHTGNVEAARKIYETAVARHVDLPGTNYRLALLALQRNHYLEAQQRLERSTLDGDKVAECGYVLARLGADRGDLEEGLAQFERGTRVQPFEGRYFFYYGEILRRQGKPQAAITAFEQALNRPYTVADGDLYLFKERLAKVEYGRDDVFNAELAARLKEEPVGGDWLLLEAAQDLDHQSLTAAAEHLRQAENRLPSTLYAELTHDYFFQAQAERPELTSLLSRTANLGVSSAGPSVLDPATWSPERADPAMWPTASGQAKR